MKISRGVRTLPQHRINFVPLIGYCLTLTRKPFHDNLWFAGVISTRVRGPMPAILGQHSDFDSPMRRLRRRYFYHNASPWRSLFVIQFSLMRYKMVWERQKRKCPGCRAFLLTRSVRPFNKATRACGAGQKDHSKCNDLATSSTAFRSSFHTSSRRSCSVACS